jgi:hypothetical protein
MKKIVGRTDHVDDALKRLDVLTREENLMTAARTLEIAQHVDDKITIIEEVLQGVNGNVRATQELTYHVDRNVTATKEVINDIAGDVKETEVLAHHVDDNVTVIKELTCELRSDVNDNIKVTKHGAPHTLVSTYTYPSFLTIHRFSNGPHATSVTSYAVIICRRG